MPTWEELDSAISGLFKKPSEWDLKTQQGISTPGEMPVPGRIAPKAMPARRDFGATPPQEFGPLEELGRGLRRGFSGAGFSALGAARGIVQAIDKAEDYALGLVGIQPADPSSIQSRLRAEQDIKYQQDLRARELARKRFGPSASVEEGGTQPSNWRWWASTIGEQVPQLAAQVGAAYASAGQSIPLQVAAWAAPSGVISGGSVYSDTYERLKKKNYSEDDASNTALIESAIVGSITSAIEIVPGAVILRKMPGGEAVLKKGIQESIKRSGTKFIQGAISEGGEEVAQGAVEHAFRTILEMNPEDERLYAAIQKIMQADPRSDPWSKLSKAERDSIKEAGNRAAGEALIGGVLGGAIGAGVEAADIVSAGQERAARLQSLKAQHTQDQLDRFERQATTGVAKSFYEDPEEAVKWAINNPDKADDLLNGRRYTSSAFRKADESLPEYAGEEGAGDVRRTWYKWIEGTKSSPPDVQEALKSIVSGGQGAGGWVLSPKGAEKSPDLEYFDTPIGTLSKPKEVAEPAGRPEVVTPEPVAAEAGAVIQPPTPSPSDIIPPETVVEPTTPAPAIMAPLPEAPIMPQEEISPPVTLAPIEQTIVQPERLPGAAIPTPAGASALTAEAPALTAETSSLAPGRIAPAPKPAIEAEAAAIPDAKLSEFIAARMESLHAKPEERIEADEFFRMADEAYGGTREQGTYGPSDAYDALETGVNRSLVGKTDPRKPLAEAINEVASLQRLTERLPSQTNRSGEKELLQQFSTPPAYAYVANWAANLSDKDVVLEPSAGVGGLAVHATNSGAKVYGNEISPRRAALLKTMPVEGVFTEDAEQIQNILPGKMPAPTVVVMNPPFSRAGYRLGTKMAQGTDIKHIDASLKLMAPGGRLVAIVGAGLHGRGKGFDAWAKGLAGQGLSLRADIEVGRDVYKGYGTTFPTRLLVIDKSIPAEGAAPVVGSAETLPDAMKLLEVVRNDRQAIGPEAGVRVGEPGVAEEGRRPRRAGAKPGRPAGELGVPEQPREPGEEIEGKPRKKLGAVAERPGATGVAAEPRPAGEPRGGREEVGGRPEVDVTEVGGPRVGEQPVEPRPAAAVPGVEPEFKAKPEPKPEPEEAAERKLPKGKKELTDDVYEEYEPEYVFPDRKTPHPAPLVETAAMAAVKAPKITYQPDLPDGVIDGKLSSVQIEAVARAGQAHEAQIEIDGKKYRSGFLIGDGTGVGKGRENAGVILDNMRRGRKKAVWISQSNGLINDAERDWEGLGHNPDDIFSHAELKSGADIKQESGILFTTYDTLKQTASQKSVESGLSKSRLDQIVDWLGDDFDGAIIFDESHAMGNSVSDDSGGNGRGKKKASKKALAGVELQERLPNARVVYSSATAATEVTNLAYAGRLGMWGKGTSFANRKDFVDKISSGGLAAMEKVASDMKAMGLYVSRNLSFKGVQYERLEHTLNDDQEAQYDRMAEGWSVVLQNIDIALNRTGQAQSGMAKQSAMRQLWGANQRFWNLMITAMQAPAVIKQIEADLKAGRAAVVQLTNTNEAAQSRAIQARQEDESLEDLDMSPKQTLIDYLERSFPVQQYEEDAEGNMVPALDSNKNPIPNLEAVAIRDQMIEDISSIPVANRGALDMIIDHFGANAVSEVTGRKERLVRDAEGNMVRQPWSSKHAQADIKRFMDGERNILVFSEKGGTGASYHADLDSKNQRERRHYLLQAGWRADKALQGLGRTHRSNQAQPPIYVLVHTNIKGQKRFISTIARRLAQLGALTKGQRQAGESGVLKAADNLESTEARTAMYRLLNDIVKGGVNEITADDFEASTGLSLRDTQGNLATTGPSIIQVLNRLLTLPVKKQDIVFDEFEKRLDMVIEEASAKGELDVGMETIRATKIEKVSEKTVYTHKSGAETKYVVAKASYKTKPASWDEIQKKKNIVRYSRSVSSDRTVAVEATGIHEADENGRLRAKVKLHSPTGYTYNHLEKLDNDRHWTTLSESEANEEWDRQVSEVPEFHEVDIPIVTGVLLPIWDRVTGKPNIVRMITDDGEQILGRRLQPNEVSATLRNLGASEDAPQLTTDQAVKYLMDNRGRLILANGWSLKRSRVAGANRIELSGPSFYNNAELQSDGVFTEKVGYAVRYFIPTGEKSTEVLGKVLEGRPITEAVPYSGEAPIVHAMGQSAKRETGPPRQPLSPIDRDDVEAVSAIDILKKWSELFGVPMRLGHFNFIGAAAIYKQLPEVIRSRKRYANYLGVHAHEIAHHVDKKEGVISNLPGDVEAELSSLDYDQDLRRSNEGWAEFVRMWLAGPADDKEAAKFAGAAKATKWFEETWLPEHKKWQQPFNAAKSLAEQFSKQGPKKRIASGIEGMTKKPKSVRLRMEGLIAKIGEGWKTLYRGMFASDDEWRILHDKLMESGRLNRDQMSSYERNKYASNQAVNDSMRAIRNGVHYIGGKTGLVGGPSFQSAMDLLNSNEEYEEASIYTYSKHAIEAYEQNESYNPGFDIEDARYVVSEVESDPEKFKKYGEFASIISSHYQNLLKMAQEAGLIDQGEYDAMAGKYQHYVPLMRHIDGTDKNSILGGIANKPRTFKGRSIGGSGAKLMDLQEALIARTAYVYGRAHGQQTLLQLARELDPQFGGSEGMGWAMERLDPDRIIAARATWEEVLGQLVKDGLVEENSAKEMRIASKLRSGADVSDQNLRWLSGKYGIEGGTEEELLQEVNLRKVPDIESQIAIWRPDYAPKNKENIIRVIIDGQKILYQVDPEMHNLLVGLQSREAKLAWMKGARMANAMFRGGAISFSSGFGMKQIFSDPIDYFISGTEESNLFGRVWKPYWWMMKSAYSRVADFGAEASDPILKLYDQASGGTLSPFNDYFKQTARQRLKPTKLDRFMTAIKEIITIADMGPRLTEFNAVLKRYGYTASGGKIVDGDGKEVDAPELVLVKAYNAAAEATVNFRRFGSVTRVVNDFIPLLNAGLQAADKTVRVAASLRHVAKADRSGEIARNRIMAIAAFSAFSVLYHMLMQDDDEYRAEDEEHADQWYLIGGIQIPKGRGLLGLIDNLIGAGINSVTGARKDNPLYAASRFSRRSAAVGGGVLVTAGQFAAGYDFYRGKPIEGPHLKQFLPEDRYGPYTLETSKGIGKRTGKVGLSPSEIEYLLSGITGGIYTRQMGFLERIAASKLGPRDVPFARVLVKPSSTSGDVNDFYDALDLARQAAGSAKKEHGLTDVEVDSVADRLDEYNILMRQVRNAVGGDLKRENVEKYLVGLAREALGLKALEKYPSLIDATDLPPQLKEVRDAFAARLRKSVRVSIPRKRMKGETDEQLKARQEEARSDRERRRETLKRLAPKR